MRKTHRDITAVLGSCDESRESITELREVDSYLTNNEAKISLRREMRGAFNEFQSKILPTDLNQTLKKFWFYVKSVSESKSSVQSHIDHNGSETEEILNSVFQNCFTAKDLNTVSPFSHRTNTEITDVEVSKIEVEKQLQSLSSGKAPGPDEIPVRFYTDYAKKLAPLLTTIYRRSLEQSKVPNDWKKEQVITIFKKGRRTDANNYRPISPTSISCRIVEHVLCSRIMTLLGN